MCDSKIAECKRFFAFSLVIWVSGVKGTLPCPKPTPMENTRKNSKNSKTPKTLDLGVSLQGTTFPENKTKKSAIRAGPNRCRNDVPFVSEIGLFL
jgi:hypothetical protein